jgi:hypothetical protein
MLMPTTMTVATRSVFSAVNTVATQQASSQTLVVFDSRVEDLQTCQAALMPYCRSTVVSEQIDALEFISFVLEASRAKELVIVAHGEPGMIHLGITPITLKTLRNQAHLLAKWGVKEITLYSYGAGISAEFVAQLGELTGATVTVTTGKMRTATLGNQRCLC